MNQAARKGGPTHLLHLLLLLVMAGVVGGSALTTLPPDEHEVLVVRTAQEMVERADWIVPWFNGAPRLNKPPMNYWLSGGVAALSGSLPAVSVGQGRLVSLLAGLVCLVLTAGIARRLYDDFLTTVLAPALSLASAGWFSFVHDARPDMLYAMFCLLGVWAFFETRTAAARSKHAAWLMWIAFALACLSKGPQIPFLLLLGIAMLASRTPQSGRWQMPRGLQWFPGLLLLVAMTLPWWWLVQLRLPPETLGGSQLSGTLLRPGLSHLTNGYYLYRPLQLCLPWVPLVPLAWWFALRESQTGGHHSRALLVLIAVVAAGLSLGPQQRYFYMLPVLPLMMIITARGLVVARRCAPRTIGLLGLAQGALVFAAALWLSVETGRVLLLMLVASCAAALGLLLVRGRQDAILVAVLPTVLLVGAVFAVHAGGPPLWSSDRFNKHELALSVRDRVPPNASLVSYRLTPAVYVYTTSRTIERLEQPAALERARAAAHPACLYVLTEVVTASSLAFSPVTVMPPDADDRAGLYCYKK